MYVIFYSYPTSVSPLPMLVPTSTLAIQIRADNTKLLSSGTKNQVS